MIDSDMTLPLLHYYIVFIIIIIIELILVLNIDQELLAGRN